MIFDFLREHGFEAEKLKAVLFDMDGVLYDSMPNHVAAWIEGARRFGLTISQQEVYMNEGRTGNGTINMLARREWGRDATEEEWREIYRVKSELFNTFPTAMPMPGAREALDAIKAAGIQCIIVTGSGQHSLFHRLAAAFPNIFSRERMVTAFDVKHGKPHPEPYLMGLRKAGVSAGEAVVVENAPLGIQAAKAADLFTIAVNTGPLSDDVLYNAGADVVLPSMTAFARLVAPRP